MRRATAASIALATALRAAHARLDEDSPKGPRTIFEFAVGERFVPFADRARVGEPPGGLEGQIREKGRQRRRVLSARHRRDQRNSRVGSAPPA